MAMGDHLQRHRWSRGPSIAAILGLGGPSTATYFTADGPGAILGDHLWHDSSLQLWSACLSNGAWA